MESLAEQFPDVGDEPSRDTGTKTNALTNTEADSERKPRAGRSIRLADLGAKPSHSFDSAPVDIEATKRVVGALPANAVDALDAEASADAEQREEVLRAFDLIRQAGGSNSVCEIRGFEARDGESLTFFGLFDNRDALAGHFGNGDARQNIYITLNPVKSNLSPLNPPEFSRGKGATSKSDVESRKWFLVDCDPKRPSGTASSAEEHEAAHERAQQLRDYLCTTLGWREPVVCDSGNGAHLLYRIDLPNDDVSTSLIKKCLKALDARFSDDIVTIDTTVGDAARITRLYGTTNYKGIAMQERPHRRSRIISKPNDLGVVARTQLQALAAEVKQTTLGSLDQRAQSDSIPVGKHRQAILDYTIAMRQNGYSDELIFKMVKDQIAGGNWLEGYNSDDPFTDDDLRGMIRGIKANRLADSANADAGCSREPLSFVDIIDFEARAFPPASYIVKYLFPVGGLVLLSGESGATKTAFTVHALLGAILNKRVGSRFNTLSQMSGPILYLNGDMSPSLMQQTIRQAAAGYGIGFGSIPKGRFVFEGADGCSTLRFSSDSSKATDKIERERFLTMIEKLRPSVIVFDTQRALFDLDEKENLEIVNEFRRLRELAKSFDCCIIVLHHLRKSSTNGNSVRERVSGGTALIAESDVHLAAQKNGKRSGMSRFIVDKTRYPLDEVQAGSEFTVESIFEPPSSDSADTPAKRLGRSTFVITGPDAADAAATEAAGTAESAREKEILAKFAQAPDGLLTRDDADAGEHGGSTSKKAWATLVKFNKIVDSKQKRGRSKLYRLASERQSKIATKLDSVFAPQAAETESE